MKINEQKRMKQTKSSQPRVMCQFKLYLFTTDRYVSIETPPIHLQEACVKNTIFSSPIGMFPFKIETI
jgi:hypothetical protein